ncbi:uncharacterized protein ACA1_218610 [Acanthamoeba castellanii str. Neff]|uniref:RNA polymerase II-associated factor 1 homolog n=1 Tax=Acanthamoeba castellanii (strain ATCC 30010 / Neff) TaxID=1257118 RepID=L8GQN3_ACACF|nr:uncharacterized protein ACA1_218610 [Acanthamoeba castellanii str. Neff]ELR15207.1 hypothetical protein ACA1_218610 [Acanthamoeba castellanii str. Neff]
MKFSNTLPPIPFDPKLLTNPFDSMRFVRYRTTSLETSHQHTLHAEPDLGIPIDLIDPSTYKATPGAALPPEDAVLIQVGAAETPEVKKKKANVREKPSTSVSWLRRHTEYISDYEQSTKKVSRADSIEARVGHATLKRAEKDKRKRTREEVVDAIDQGFEAAKEIPVHPTDPSLKPLEILPVFPDHDLWANSYTLVTFDADPGRPRAQKQALLKGFSTEAEAEVGLAKQSFVAYLVPKNDGNDDEGKGKKKVGDEDDEGAAVEEVDGKTAEYEWVREYSFRKDQQHSATYFFVWDDESVRYNEIQAKIVLDKIKSQAAKDAIRRQARPSHSYVTTRNPTEDELEAMELARDALAPF